MIRLMKIQHCSLLLLLMLSLFAIPVSAQKHLDAYEPESLFNDGLVLFQNGEYGAAQSAFNQFLAKAEDEKSQQVVDARYYEAVSALYTNQSDAEAKIKAFVNDHPGSTWSVYANFLYANVLFDNKKYAEAMAIYQQTPAASLNQSEAQQMQFNMGYAYLQMDQMEKALPIFQGLALNEGKYQDAAKYYYSHIQYQRGRDDESLRYFDQLREHPVYGRVVPAYLMQLNYRNGNYEAVLRDGPEAVRNAPAKNQGEMAMIVADAYFHEKDYAQALAYYTFFSRNNMRSMTREAYYQMGACKMKTGDLKGAIADLQKAASDKDTTGQYASYYLASCYADTDQPKFARNAFYTAYSAGFDKQISEDALFNYAKLSLIPGTDPFNEAVSQLDAFLAENPTSTRRDEAEEMAVYLLLNAKNNDQALARLEKIRNKSPELKAVYEDLLFTTGIDYYQNKQYDKAQPYFSKILNSKQSNEKKAEAAFWLAESAYGDNDFVTAERYFKMVKSNRAASRNLTAKADYGLGYIDYQKPDYDAAIEHFRGFIQKYEDTDNNLKSDAYIRLGDCFFMDRNYDLAINYYDLATRVGKMNADYALFQQGLCYGAKGDSNRKIAMLHDMMTTYPSTSYYDRALFEIGNTHLVYGDKRSAIAAFDRLTKERPRSSYTRQALMKKGMIYYNNNQYDQALTNLKTLVENYPNTDESREALSIIRSIFMERNDLNSYFAYVEKSGTDQIQVTQQDSLAFTNAENFFLDGRYQEAEKALNYYFNQFPRGAFALKAHHYAAECAEKVGTEEEVATHLTYILRQPNNDYTDQALLKLARIEYEQGNYEQAGEYYARLANVTEEPLRKLEALEGSMKSYFFRNNYDKAIEMGESLIQSKDLTQEQINQINHIVGKSYFMKDNYTVAQQWLDKSARDDKSVFGAESAYYSAVISFKENDLDGTESKVFDLSEKFASHEYWVAKSFILLAEVYEAKDNEFQAKETLRSVVNNCSITELKTEAQNRLDHIK